jgi:DNA-binding LacI/PurR family transcriptional regulator
MQKRSRLQAIETRWRGADVPVHGFPSIRLDVEAGVRAAMAHLIGLGHTRIGHIGASVTAPVQAETFTRRRNAYEQCLRNAGIRADRTLQAATPFAMGVAVATAARMLMARKSPTAMFCDSDVLAAAVYKAAYAARRAIPRDLSVVSIDDSLVARILQPELTTVAIPAEVVGQQAVALLLDELKNGSAAACAGVIQRRCGLTGLAMSQLGDRT